MATAEELKNAQLNATAPQPTANEQSINQMYDSNLAAKNAQLQSAYDRSMSDAQAAKAQINPLYNTQQNDLATTYERQRRNYNTMAASNGINTGAGSQAQLAQQLAYQKNMNNLNTARANAIAEADRSMANLSADYQSQIAAAAADNDYRRMAALIDERNNQRNIDTANAKQLASAGDFSGFLKVGYTPEQVSTMQSAWIAQNPKQAYLTGMISSAEYDRLTGNTSSKRSSGGYTVPVTEEETAPVSVEDFFKSENAKNFAVNPSQQALNDAYIKAYETYTSPTDRAKLANLYNDYLR